MSVPTDKMILNCAVVTVVSTVGAKLYEKEFPEPRLLIGTAFAFMGLGMMGDFAPGPARGFALCMAVAALTLNGFPILDQIFNAEPNSKG